MVEQDLMQIMIMMVDLVVVVIKVGHLAVVAVDTREEMHLQRIGQQRDRAKVDIHITLVQTKQILLHWVIILIKAKS
jgi:hypothetical protein